MKRKISNDREEISDCQGLGWGESVILKGWQWWWELGVTKLLCNLIVVDSYTNFACVKINRIIHPQNLILLFVHLKNKIKFLNKQ